MVEHILRTIPMMDIGIDDGHTFYAVGLAYMLNHNGFDIDSTEPTNAMNHSHRMMPWWSNEGKGSINLTS